MPERVNRIETAEASNPSVIVGKTRCSTPPTAAGRHPVELHGEKEDQDEAQPEIGYGLAEYGQKPCHPVRRCRAIECGNDSQRYTEDQRKHQRRRAELQSLWSAAGDFTQRRTRADERVAKVELDRIDQEIDVLNADRSAEAELLFE